MTLFFVSILFTNNSASLDLSIGENIFSLALNETTNLSSRDKNVRQYIGFVEGYNNSYVVATADNYGIFHALLEVEDHYFSYSKPIDEARPPNATLYSMDSSFLDNENEDKIFCGNFAKPRSLLPKFKTIRLDREINVHFTKKRPSYNCPLGVHLHSTYIQRHGDGDFQKAKRHAIEVLSESIDIIYRQVGVRIPIQYISPLQTINPKRTKRENAKITGQEILDEMKSLLKNDKLIPESLKHRESMKICVYHTLTHIDDPSILGLAYTDEMCSRDYLNIGMSTTMSFGKPIKQHIEPIVVAHEIMHNLGSPHDTEFQKPELCDPPSKYLMSPYLPKGKNAKIASPCTREIVARRLEEANSCVVPLSEDECRNSEFLPPAPSGHSYVACSIRYPESGCLLICQDPDKPGICTSFEDKRGVPVMRQSASELCNTNK
ncbi:hypothetical protein ROZALSC1DRAFT_30902 [Rozella allomycis CSF55]|uniref:Peptidase M12B domain-containing protein n=1 Tax=Rozella allomycis (strain CSF55) TaxID=988480 RepID=A0A4P9YD56_ROZAC|nr:hypothetical protein ROZALSC1DRAFT_30902 [Rozella allomycis CSF55]